MTHSSQTATLAKPSVQGRVDLDNETISLATLLELPQETASGYRAVLFRERTDKKTKERVISLAVDDPSSEAIGRLVGFLEHNNKVKVELYEASRDAIDAQLARYLGAETSPDANESSSIASRQSAVESVGELEAVVQSAVVPNIINAIIFFARSRKASDIHIEPMAETVQVRYRIDGSLTTVLAIPRYFRHALISRIKILAGMKIDEQRIPQDGRFEFDHQGHSIDIRVATLPTVHGEKVEMRLLDKDAGILTLEQLGITGNSYDAVVRAISKPYGIIFATGPTGSGKSTTLYAILNRIAKPNTNVVTLEDPVEYEIAGANQSQVNPNIGYTFAEGLRAVLRQDPNIIMVGEVRDQETAGMVTHAALTGHLVLTTLHTNDSAGALPRLTNMGVEPYLLTSSINAIIAQRLARKLCIACRQQVELPPALIDNVRSELGQLKNFPQRDQSSFTFYQAVGCGECTDGYAGRIGLFEVLVPDETIEQLALVKQSASAIAQAARVAGMITLKQDGILKALKGITSIDEVLRVTTEE